MPNVCLHLCRHVSNLYQTCAKRVSKPMPTTCQIVSTYIKLLPNLCRHCAKLVSTFVSNCAKMWQVCVNMCQTCAKTYPQLASTFVPTCANMCQTCVKICVNMWLQFFCLPFATLNKRIRILPTRSIAYPENLACSNKFKTTGWLFRSASKRCPRVPKRLPKGLKQV